MLNDILPNLQKNVFEIIRNKDFFKRLDENPNARNFYLENQAAKHIIKRYVLLHLRTSMKSVLG